MVRIRRKEMRKKSANSQKPNKSQREHNKAKPEECDSQDGEISRARNLFEAPATLHL